MTKLYRIGRTIAQNTKPSAFTLTDRQRDRQDTILRCGTAIIAECGAAVINFTNLAVSLRLTRAALRFHFADMNTLLVEILQRHLLTIDNAIGDIPRTDPNLHQRRRAAYLAATRTPTGAFTEAHLIFVRDRCLLPPDLRAVLDLTHQGLGRLLAGDLGEEALILLDSHLDPERIEARLGPAAAPIALPPQPVEPEATTQAPPAWTPSYPTLFCGPPDDPTAPIAHAPLIPPEPAAPERRRT